MHPSIFSHNSQNFKRKKISVSTLPQVQQSSNGSGILAIFDENGLDSFELRITLHDFLQEVISHEGRSDKHIGRYSKLAGGKNTCGRDRLPYKPDNRSEQLFPGEWAV